MPEHSDTTPEPRTSDTDASKTDATEFGADDARRAAHATEPGLGAEGETTDEPDTVTGNAVDVDSDGDEDYRASKPVPAEGGGPLP